MGETEESSKCGKGDRVSGGKEPKIRKIRRANLSLGQSEAFAVSINLYYHYITESDPISGKP